MTDLEIKRKSELERRLTYGRGIFSSEWPVLIGLRKKALIERGENPNDYNLDGRCCTKK